MVMSTIILGIDPGLQKTGWGVIRSEGARLTYIASGRIETQAGDILAGRLAHIHRTLCALIERWKPDTAAVEETFMNNNPAAALKLGQARGVALAVPALYGLSVGEYGANKIKKSITGTGHAHKDQIGLMVKMLLPGCGLEGKKVGPDEADALAAAICHAHHFPLRRHPGASRDPHELNEKIPACAGITGI